MSTTLNGRVQAPLRFTEKIKSKENKNLISLLFVSQACTGPKAQIKTPSCNASNSKLVLFYFLWNIPLHRSTFFHLIFLKKLLLSYPNPLLTGSGSCFQLFGVKIYGFLFSEIVYPIFMMTDYLMKIANISFFLNRLKHDHTKMFV